MHPELTDEDLAYVRSGFRPQTERERERAAAGLAPQPSYLLPDGTAMIPAAPDPELAAATDARDLRRRFLARWLAAGGSEPDAEAELEAWLDGGYGVCLRSPGPEAILAKDGLARTITALSARPAPDQAWWRASLRHAVNAYDELVLPFASVDPARFGAPTSRMRLVDAVRARWPEVFACDRRDDGSGAAHEQVEQRARPPVGPEVVAEIAQDRVGPRDPPVGLTPGEGVRRA